MLARRPKLSVVILCISGCLLGLVWCCVGALAIGKVPEIDKQSYLLPEKPVRTMTITVDSSHQDELFAKLQKFADKWGYATRIAPDGQDARSYTVQMWRIDMKLIGSYSTASGTLKLGFYNTNPASQNPWWFFDKEISNLQDLIREIPNSTFSVKK